MKPQKEITSSIALLFLAQNLFFPAGVMAQGGNASTVSAVAGMVGNFATQLPSMYAQNPSSPNFLATNSSIQSSMNRCLTQSVLGITGNAAADQKNIEGTLAYFQKKNKGDTADTSDGKVPMNCSADCSLNRPDDLAEEPNCNDYSIGNIKHGGENKSDFREAKDSAFLTIIKQQDSIQDYVTCLKGKKDCADADKAALDKQMAVFQCQMRALNDGVQQASQALAQSLQANQKTFTDMNLHQQQVGAQMQQIDEILGPDPELGKSGASEFQGLLGMQKELNETLPKMTQADTKYKTDIEALKNDTTTNEQNLEANRVNVASSCIKGSRNVGTEGGYSLTCFKPIMSPGKDASTPGAPMVDKNGNTRYSKQSCGPYEYIRSKIEQSAFITSRGVMMDQARRDQAAANATGFDSLVDSINRAMGDYDQKGADNARLDTDVHSWSDIESKVSGNIDAVAGASGVDVRGMLRSVAGHCFQEADGWKNKQMRSTDSEYSKKKAELKSRQTAMTSDMDTGLTAMNKSYHDVMSLLSGKAVSLNRAQCTKTDPAKMEECFANVKQNLQNLLEGNGQLTTTAKNITGTPPNTPGFTVSCRGLNGCVTQFKNVRDFQKKYIRDVQKKKDVYVAQGNQATQTQLTVLGSQLSLLQNSLMAQYDQMKQTMGKMGVIAPDRPKSMDPEALQASAAQPPDTSTGPFGPPKNMAAVLSGMMQPAGMINFADTGMADAQRQVNEKATAKKTAANDELKTYLSMQKKYKDVWTDCLLVGKGGASGGPASVSNVGISCDDCVNSVNACQSSIQPSSGNGNQDAITAKQKQIDDLTASITAMDAKKDKKKITESNKILAQYKIDLTTLQNAPKVVDQSAANFATLQNLGDIFSKMAAGTASKDEYAKLGSPNMGVLWSLQGSVDGCDGVYNTCRTCKSDGKGVYTEASKNGSNGGTIKGGDTH